MPNDGLLMQHMLASSGLAQYPDAKLYNSAKLLTPEERPQKTPLKVVDDRWRAEQGAQASFMPWNEKYSPEPTHIRVQKRAKDYKGAEKRPERLAAVIAHEAAHERGLDEGDAYQVQYDVLQRLGEKDKELFTALLARIGDERAFEAEKKRRKAVGLPEVGLAKR